MKLNLLKINNKKIDHWTWLCLTLILILAFSLRFIKINDIPPRLLHDEMSLGYNAYSILKTGRDEWGKWLPLNFEAFGDHKLPGYVYAQLPFIALLGLNTLAIKLPSILAGVAIVLATYFICKQIYTDKKIALLAAFLMAINPWPINISRLALESNLGLAFFTWSLFFQIKLLQKPNWRDALIAGVLSGTSFYCYIAYRLISVLQWLIYIVLAIKEKPKNKYWLLALIICFITILPLLPHFLNTAGTARFSQVSIFVDKGIQSQIVENNNFCFLNNMPILAKLCRLLYFKSNVAIVETLVGNYIKMVSPTFLFIEGDKLDYLNFPNQGAFYFILAPFYLIGFFVWWQQKSSSFNYLKILALFTPIANALAGYPHFIRGTAFLIFPILFCAQGIVSVINYFHSKNLKKTLVAVLVLIFSFSATKYLITYWFVYPHKYESSFNELPNQLKTFLQEHREQYDSIYFSKSFTDAHIWLAFQFQIDPQWYQSAIVRPEPDAFGFRHPIKLGKYHFKDENLNNILCQINQEKILYITNNYEGLTPQWTFKDFANVHTQAQVFDLQFIKTQGLITRPCSIQKSLP